MNEDDEDTHESDWHYKRRNKLIPLIIRYALLPNKNEYTINTTTTNQTKLQRKYNENKYFFGSKIYKDGYWILQNESNSYTIIYFHIERLYDWNKAKS